MGPLIALPTCVDLPEWEVDDRLFHTALRQLGIEVEQPIWDDAAVEWSRYDAVVIRTTWDYQEKWSHFVRWARRVSAVTELINPVDIVEWNTCKTYLRDLALCDAPFVETVWLDVGQEVDLRSLVEARGWQRAFLKPCVGATARETLRFDASAEGLRRAEAHLQRLLPSEAMILQPYLVSVESEGEYSGIFYDGEFAFGVRKVPVSGDYRVQDDFGASDEHHSFAPADRESMDRVMAALRQHLDRSLGGGRPAYARIDMLRGPSGTLSMNEVELVEPSLFFRHDPSAGMRFAAVLAKRLGCRSA
jgi:hypothetical protein